MKLTIALSFITATLGTAAFAEGHLAGGDPEAGERTFNRCKACHMIEGPDEIIVRGGRTGPNLYGVIGRTAGTVEGFRYGDALVSAGEAGLVWDADSFLPYVEDPQAFLAEYLDDSGARSKMAFKLRDGGADIYAYLVTVGPEMEADSGS